MSAPAARVWLAAISLVLLTLAAPFARAQPSKPATTEQTEFFEAKIRPVLAENCLVCHGLKKQQAGLRLDSRDAVLKGSDDRPVVVPGQPDKSVLLKAVRHQGDVKMPPKAKLSDQTIADLSAWIEMGLPWPKAKNVTAAANDPDAWRKHWAFQPIRNSAPPRIKDATKVLSPVDAFIQTKLDALGLTPAPLTDRRTLLRRVSVDLIGLPPTADEIEAFEKDQSADAFAKGVDRLLASPRYGERWGRYWLDVARYADTKGYVFQEERRYPYSYTYRDYVVRAFNEDLPYDRFIHEQLAADRLVSGDDKRPLAAMGFLTLGRRFLNNVHDIIDDRIDVTTRGLLGLTVSCARCHDHKYDPIPTQDYYSLYGVFANSVESKDPPVLVTPAPTPEYLAYEKELKAREAVVAQYREDNKAELAAGNRKFRDGLRAVQKKLDGWKLSPAAPPRPMMLEDAPNPVSPRVFVRGNPSNPGPAVPRQFLKLLAGDQRQPFQKGSGRLEMARAIASKDNPLTARVLVNRVWLHHFGAGLVATPSDFGLRGEPPSHPELLDYLAWQFMEEGWSLKKLHRRILLSRVYQQSSRADAKASRIDPENRFLARMNRRRLDFEALRDALLSVSGKLDLTMGGPSVDLLKTPFTGRRTLYGFIDRQNLPGMFRTFDFASPDSSAAQRFLTTVPQQALYLLNSPFVLEQAGHLLRRPELAKTTAPAERIQQMYRLIHGRAADGEEQKLGLAFVSAKTPTVWERYAQVLLLANEFAFVD